MLFSFFVWLEVNLLGSPESFPKKKAPVEAFHPRPMPAPGNREPHHIAKLRRYARNLLKAKDAFVAGLTQMYS